MWGCPKDYYMFMGKCYKLFKQKKTQIEAQMICSEDQGILAKPLWFAESEFLESLVSYMEENKNIEDPVFDSVWLNIRRGDIETSPDTFFADFLGHSNGNLLTETGDCLAMKIGPGIMHEGWHRLDCNIESYFICEKSTFSFQYATGSFYYLLFHFYPR